MTLNQALTLIRTRNSGSPNKQSHFLACGFEPLHLKTFFHASLLERRPDTDITVICGVYGDFVGNLSRATESTAHSVGAVVEWSDIDPRLGVRGSGGWSETSKPDIIASVAAKLNTIGAALQNLGTRLPVAVAMPSLPMVPAGSTISAQMSSFEAELECLLSNFVARAAALPGVRVLSPARLSAIPTAERLDPKMELLAGFPYKPAYAACLANALTEILLPPQPRKGLITDLDDTLWSGIVGEIGPDKVSWSQDAHTQIHGLYQQMLAHLSECGVLLAVCSKNELSNVEEAFARPDLLVKPKAFFPVCANWEAKSRSVGRILQTWNIAADSVVFIDDSPMELDEVQKAFPGIEVRRFQGRDPAAMWNLLTELRDLFGKPQILDEDRLRQASIRASSEIAEMGEQAESPEFLRSLEGTVSIDWRLDPADKRPLELINKTNQFNLNGHRIGDADWQRYLADPATLLAVVSYADKFGPLGKVAVVLGSQHGDEVEITHWVMSCRAFARHLEHHTLEALFRHTGAASISFDYAATSRNKPLSDFFSTIGITESSGEAKPLAREALSLAPENLPHQLAERI